jgi:hypothetical protein
VLLRKFSFDPSIASKTHPAECGKVLKESELLDFEGEIVLIVDSLSFTLVPKQFFDEELGRDLLQKVCTLEETDQIQYRFIRNRSMVMLFAVPEGIVELQKQFRGEVKIIHISECLVSLSDQVQASDHQRGAVLIDVQPYTLDLLVIQGDQIRLLNRYPLKETSEFIYHALNTVKQLDLDRESIPVYLSGIVHEEHELYGLLGKYLRTIRTTPYYMEELSKMEVLQYMILSEGSKCA